MFESWKNSYQNRTAWIAVISVIIVCTIILLYFCFEVHFKLFFNKRRKARLLKDEEAENKIDSLQVEIGKKHFSQNKVIVCGLARNIEETFEYLKSVLKDIVSIFENYEIVFVENDSSDKTRELLFDLKKNASSYGFESDKIHILKLDSNNENLIIDDETPWTLNLPVETGKKHSRITKMVFLRNVYMKYINEFITPSNFFEYTVMIDCDNVTQHAKPKNWEVNPNFIQRFSHCGYFFEKDETINGIGANTVSLLDYKYYDSFSLDFYPDSLFSYTGGFNGKDLIPVKSCFGGMMIYKTKSIQGKFYSTFIRIDLFSSFLGSFKELKFPICEHKPFNYLVGNIYINPRFLIFVDYC